MFDSLVTDLMFAHGAELDPEVLVTALGGEDAASTRKILDPDMQDPRLEMEMSPSMPFRRRGERRLLIIDDSVAPMRSDPESEFTVSLDLRPERDRLIALCEAMDVRLGRIFALGTWGDAVLIARSARDLRGVALISWALDPTVDIDGHPYGRRLTQAEFEAKLAAYDKRLEELDDDQILGNLEGVNIERRGELIILDVLEDDGTWNMRRSTTMERLLAAVDRFSLIPGAPAAPRPDDDAADAQRGAPAADDSKPAADTADDTAPAAPVAAPDGSVTGSLAAIELGEQVVLVLSLERFDLEVAAALGKRDYDAVIHPGDGLPGPVRDRLQREGGFFAAPVEFYSEVFLDGKPLARPHFDAGARELPDGTRAMPVHCPRFGPVTLAVTPDNHKFITSVPEPSVEVLAELRAYLITE